jgi:hypothetical protein
MSANNTVTTLNGLFKETYAKELKNLIPDQVKLINMVPFLPKDKNPGNLYHQPVILGLEHGVTFASSDDDAFTLNAPVSGTIKDAQVKGCPAVLRSVLGYVAASRASQGSTQAFMDATKFLIANMLRSMAKKIEIEMLYGQAGYGTVAASTSAATALTVTTAEWAPGIWAGSEGLTIEVRSVDGATSRGEFLISSVNMETRVITISTAATLTAGDVIWHKGAYGTEFVGIHQILSQTTGTLFNINVGTFNLFRGNKYDAGSAALSFSKLTLASSRAVEKGLDGKLVAMVNPRAWANMLSDQAALRKYDNSYSRQKLENGTEKLTFFSQNGEIEIVPSIYVKEGYAYMLSIDDFVRVGSQDVSFNRPGSGDQVFRELENAAGFELRLYTDQAIFCSSPGKSVVITGIVNSN